VEIFDLYVGRQIGQGKKSVGVAISYRLPERSLSGAEIDQAQNKIIAGLKRQFGAEVRDK
jgi:phenylalanyl-tRNA synthetase beta chain